MNFFIKKTEIKVKLNHDLLPRSSQTSRFLFLFVFAVTFIFNLSGFSFSDIDINEDRLLFFTDYDSQRTLFLSRIGGTSEEFSFQALTAFPERLELIDGGRSLLVLNRLGASKIPASGGLVQGLEGFHSFANGNIPLGGRTHDVAVSRDGRWLLYVEPTSPAYGDLLLLDLTAGVKHKVSERVELPAVDFPARFSPDSRLFVYSKGGRLFYCPIVNDFSIIINERFRQIGPGEVTAISWGSQGGFFYFHDNILYRVNHPELLTRAFYGDFLSIGDVVAVLPFSFESNFDRYWISPDSSLLLVNKRDKNIFLFQLSEDADRNSILPHITIPQGACNINVLWSSSGLLTILASRQNETFVWRIETAGGTIRYVINPAIPLSSSGILSPDGTKAAFWGEGGLELWDYTNWTRTRSWNTLPVYSCLWLNNNEIIAGNSSFIEAINISNTNFPRSRIISFSSADQAGFEESSSRILVRTQNDWFATNGLGTWTRISNPDLRAVSQSSGRFRIYLENQSHGFFSNIPMLRDTVSMTTASIMRNHSAHNAYPQNRQMQIALCFDIYDDDTGLTQVLNALKRFNINATFFLNGDFIRRNPAAASAIAEAGHEAASLFYAPIDLADARYSIGSDFIAQGLARNEDEFLRATGREFSMLWHPPFFRSSAVASSAAQALGYVTVSRDIDIGDWLSREEALRLNLRQPSVSEIIERIAATEQNGAVVPVRIGLLQGGRDEYVFRRIDVLLDALIRSGFEIVPVSSVAGSR